MFNSTCDVWNRDDEHVFNYATDGFGALGVDGMLSCISMKLMMMNVASVLVTCPSDKIRTPD